MSTTDTWEATTEITLLADADYSTKQFYGMDVEDTTGNAKLVAAAGARAIGILLDKPSAAGEACRVAIAGRVPCVAGGTVTAGMLIKFDANGKGVEASAAVTNTSDGGSATDALIGSFVIGRALTSAASGERFSLLIQPLGAIPTTAA